jgi:hypothetical protein
LYRLSGAGVQREQRVEVLQPVLDETSASLGLRLDAEIKWIERERFHFPFRFSGVTQKRHMPNCASVNVMNTLIAYIVTFISMVMQQWTQTLSVLALISAGIVYFVIANAVVSRRMGPSGPS